MSLQDPIADMLTRIRNALSAHKADVSMPASNIKVAIATVLKDEGYIADYAVSGEGAARTLEITLKYFQGEPVIVEIDRYSKPSLRSYFKSKDLPRVKDGMGVALVSTSKGLLTDKQARAQGVGGEVLFTVF